MKTPRGPVAFQGEEGAFSEEAVLASFGRGARTLPCRTFRDVFSAVARRKAPFGVVPIENSLFGSIHENYDLLRSFNVRIAGEVKLRIVHALVAHPRARIGSVTTIYSHPQAIGQCERFLRTLRGAEVVAAYDTAGAAKMIAAGGRLDCAAIASARAARLYGLKVLRSGIESDRRNFTRFLILARPEGRVHPPAPARAKTSLLFALHNVPGALVRALSAFTLREINLYRIESRPLVGRPWEYLFYLDIAGSVREPRVARAIAHLRELATFTRILGSYAPGITIMKSQR